MFKLPAVPVIPVPGPINCVEAVIVVPATVPPVSEVQVIAPVLIVPPWVP
jgi:hypothetical protein